MDLLSSEMGHDKVTGVGGFAHTTDSICHSSATSQEEQWPAHGGAAGRCLCPGGLEGPTWHGPGHHGSTRHGSLVSQGDNTDQMTPVSKIALPPGFSRQVIQSCQT